MDNSKIKNIIQGLEHCINGKCNGCPYENITIIDDCLEILLKDTLKHIKEIEQIYD